MFLLIIYYDMLTEIIVINVIYLHPKIRKECQMSQIKEKALDMIRQMPEDYMFYVIDTLQSLKMTLANKEDKKEQAIAAYQNIQKFRGRLPENFDADKELEEARNRKYGNSC